MEFRYALGEDIYTPPPYYKKYVSVRKSCIETFTQFSIEDWFVLKEGCQSMIDKKTTPQIKEENVQRSKLKDTRQIKR